jgi:hypothetical protein
MSVTFRTTATPDVTSPIADDYVPNEEQVQSDSSDIEPVSNSNLDTVILAGLGIDSDINDMPEGDVDNLKDVSKYIKSIVDRKGLTPTKTVYQKVMKETMDELGIDPDTEPAIVLDRIGGMVQAWRDLMFIKDPGDRRRLFMKLARMDSSKSMNEFVFEQMNGNKIWL